VQIGVPDSKLSAADRKRQEVDATHRRQPNFVALLAVCVARFAVGMVFADPPVMDPLTTAAASGLQARIDALDMLGNNLANSSTDGFKVDREFYSSYLSPDALNSSDPAVGEAPVVQRLWTDFSQGTLVSTGSNTDLALVGKGFFAVDGPNGALYTRNGNLQVSKSGTLTTAQGYALKLVSGQPLQLQSASPVQISPDGQVMQDGLPLGQLQLVDFADPSQLTKLPSGYFAAPSGVTPTSASDVQVAQGKIEASNASPAESAARMVSLLRNFEMLQHAVKIGADMNRQAVEQVARVGS
jgi:flagellar basal body rod protein FlgG